MSQSDIASPYELMAEIERNARDLDAGGRQLAKAIQELSKVERVYQAEFEKQLITIYHDCKESGDRMPAEDIRRAIAHTKVDKAVYAAFLSKTAEVDALKAWTRTVAGALSARQSLLSAQRAELQAA